MCQNGFIANDRETRPIGGRVGRLLKRFSDVTTNTGARRSRFLRLRHPQNLFQPHNETAANRYPEVFNLLREALGPASDARVLSFGCSTGEEVFSLRHYLPFASLVGMDISRGNIADCRRRLRRIGDPLISFETSGSTTHVPSDTFAAILCMAVLRHGDLSNANAISCSHRITFAAFERVVTDFARCLTPGGLLAIEYSNFRFADTTAALRFECVLTHDRAYDPRIPLYGPDNRLLAPVPYQESVFRKLPD